MGNFTYPIVVSRQRYMTEIGGRSSSLERNQIGLHIDAMLSKTKLSAGDNVLINPAGRDSGTGYPSRPLFVRDVYNVEPITDFHDSRLLAMSSDGEAILSEESSLEVEYGEEVILNAAVNRLPKDWTRRIIHRYVKRDLL